MNLLNLIGFIFLLICAINDAAAHLFAGGSCELGDRTEGICTLMNDCPPAILELREQIKRRVRAGKRKYPRCGFDGFEEIVCCSRFGSDSKGVNNFENRKPQHDGDSSNSVDGASNEVWKETKKPYFPVITGGTTSVSTEQSSSESSKETSSASSSESSVESTEANPSSLTTPGKFTTHVLPAWSPNATNTEPPKHDIDITIKPMRKADQACLQYRNEIPPSLGFRIIGGEVANEGEFPHMAALGYDRDEGIEFECGGSLISDRFILTAAKCIENLEDIPPSIIRIGTVSLNGNIDPNETDFQVEQTFVHPSFKMSTKYHDVALIKLSKPVPYTAEAHPACLYTTEDDPNGQLIITGWGQTSFTKSDSKSKMLLKARLTAVSLAECAPLYSETRYKKPLPNGITSEQICAVDRGGSADACYGDAGGPLQFETDIEGIFKIVGITSFGKKCGEGVPGVYMRVAKYLNWIEEIVWP